MKRKNNIKKEAWITKQSNKFIIEKNKFQDNMRTHNTTNMYKKNLH